MADFFASECQTTLSDKQFGICDDPPPPPKKAYIIASNQNLWIATVNNPNQYKVAFVAIDNCIELLKKNGHQESRCDGLLRYDDKLIFVELKDRDPDNRDWIAKGDSQLRITINQFKDAHDISIYSYKVAYIANIQHPQFRSTQQIRMEKFKDDTGVLLRIEATIGLV